MGKRPRKCENAKEIHLMYILPKLFALSIRVENRKQKKKKEMEKKDIK